MNTRGKRRNFKAKPSNLPHNYCGSEMRLGSLFAIRPDFIHLPLSPLDMFLSTLFYFFWRLIKLRLGGAAAQRVNPSYGNQPECSSFHEVKPEC
jgi:hypothetical protein